MGIERRKATPNLSATSGFARTTVATGLMSSDFRYRFCSGLMSNTIPGSRPKTVRLQPGISVRLSAGMLFGFSPEWRSP